jgi:toxin ParE1/3/4
VPIRSVSNAAHLQAPSYLAENAGEETAERFLTQAEQTFTDLAENREIGASLTLLNPQLAGLRKWRVKDFEKFLIFY